MTLILATIIVKLYTLTAPAAVCSWYGESWNGNLTACGIVYDCSHISCAHKTLPLGSIIRFWNDDGVWLTCRVEDRGPYVTGRDFDLSEAAADSLGDLDDGIYTLRYRILGVDQADMLYNTDIPAGRLCELMDMSW